MGPSLRIEAHYEETNKWGKNIFANRLAENLKLDTTGDWDYDPKSSKEVVDHLGKKMVQGDMGKRPPNEQNTGEMDPS